jgi:hypothetical protein
MLHDKEYTILQEYIKITPEQMKYGSDTEAFRLPVSDAIYKAIKDLPKRINTISQDEDYEVKSHSLTFAPDGKILILSILLCHEPTHIYHH